MRNKMITSLFLATALVLSSSHTWAEEMKPIKEVFEPSGKFDPKEFGKVAVVQWNPHQDTPLGVTAEQAEAFKMGNRIALEAYIREAASKGAELILTPEFSLLGYPDIPELPSEEDDYRNRDDIKPYVESVPGPSTDYFAAIAKELKVTIHIGFAEVDPATDAYYNTVVAIGADGSILAKYRKINLYQLETDFLSPGKDPVTYQSQFGKIGIIICADVYSSKPMNDLKKAKTNVITLSTSWAHMNSGMVAFQRAATLANAYLAAANQTYFPDSGVVNPDGTKQSHIRQTEGIAYGYLPRVK